MNQTELSSELSSMTIAPLTSVTRRQIGIAGWGGTGTSTAAKGVVARLGGEWCIRCPASNMFRLLAQKRYPHLPREEGVALFAKDAESDLTIDEQCDRALGDATLLHHDFVADARLSGMLMPHGLRVLLVCEDSLRFQRIFDRRGEEELDISLEDIARKVQDRQEADMRRYRKLYGISSLSAQCDKVGGFHLAFDTGKVSEKDVVSRIVQAFQSCQFCDI